MSLTCVRVADPLPYRTVGNQKVTTTDITFDSSYPTGGEALAASDVGLNKIDGATAVITAVGGTVNVTSVFFDSANSKLKAFDETPGEVADTATLATLTVRVTARGY